MPKVYSPVQHVRLGSIGIKLRMAPSRVTATAAAGGSFLLEVSSRHRTQTIVKRTCSDQVGKFDQICDPPVVGQCLNEHFETHILITTKIQELQAVSFQIQVLLQSWAEQPLFLPHQMCPLDTCECRVREEKCGWV